MLVGLITLTPGHLHNMIECEMPKVQITVLSIMCKLTKCSLTLQWPERVYIIGDFPCMWLQNLKYTV
jgi:hypothetical protein